ncbi:DUF1351 domain-containing protein [Listeria floridensis]|uniref:DUF1351 domain-containing protein n=1 Tax=Listeria floridensis TaxID=1494962 RepID=UPI0005698E9E|nr:DUF1351 domain-containing protein [Listeria floridensis]
MRLTESLPKIQIQNPIVKRGSIQFNGFDEIKNSAMILASHIDNVKVTEENVKDSKRLLAAVNNEVKKLESQRIQIKNEMLIPYQTFESQVKEIVNIVKSADEKVRMQVRELEEAERDEKKISVKAIFDKRIQMYDFKNLFTFDDFLKPKYLNKTMSLTKVEAAMVKWLTQVEEDLSAIELMDHSDEVLAEYQATQNLAISVKAVQNRHALLESNKKVTFNEQTKILQATKYIYTLNNPKDARMLEMFMETNNIKFEKVEK